MSLTPSRRSSRRLNTNSEVNPFEDEFENLVTGLLKKCAISSEKNFKSILDENLNMKKNLKILKI